MAYPDYVPTHCFHQTASRPSPTITLLTRPGVRVRASQTTDRRDSAREFQLCGSPAGPSRQPISSKDLQLIPYLRLSTTTETADYLHRASVEEEREDEFVEFVARQMAIYQRSHHRLSRCGGNRPGPVHLLLRSIAGAARRQLAVVQGTRWPVLRACVRREVARHG